MVEESVGFRNQEIKFLSLRIRKLQRGLIVLYRLIGKL